MTAPAVEAEQVKVEPGEGGDPAAPQPCQFDKNPAVRSLIWADGDAYTPVCDEHEQEARDMLAAQGETVTEVVDIPQDGEPAGGEGEPESVTADAGPVEVITEDTDELRVRFPVLVIEGLDTSDGRWLAPGSLTPRALPLTLLAQPESSHGGDDPGPAIAVGRIDTMERVPGPDVVSARTGEPFPEDTFIWRGTGAISTSAEYKGQNIADMVRRRYLRGVSVDLAGMDYELLGEEGYADVDPEHPRRTLVTHSAEVAAATLVCVPAFGDAYVELEGDTTPVEPPADLVASAAPAWRSSEVGDYEALPEDATSPVTTVEVPADAVTQIAKVIDTGEDRDAEQLASDIVTHITTTWGASGPATEDQAKEGAMADQPAETDVTEPSEPAETGMPDQPQECEFGDEPATHSLIFADGEMYVAVCDEHDQDARDTIAAQGYEVEQEVPIPAEDAAEEMA